jgi:hypothetical protein
MNETKRPMLRIDLRGPMVDLRRSLERSIRERVAENVILEVHDQVYAPVRRALDPISDAVEGALREMFGGPPEDDRFRTALSELRTMLDGNARERDLQRVLVESGLLDPVGTCRAVAEVAMVATSDDPRGMRMDLVVSSTESEPAQVVELKRGSHRLLVHRGAPTERISGPFARALRQVRAYGERIDGDVEMRTNVEERHDLELDRLELRLIAGRRLPDAPGYHLLSQGEPGDGLEVHVSTWDGYLAELERIAVR